MTASATVNDGSVLAALGRLAQVQLAPAMAAIKARWMSRVLIGFNTGVSPYGDPWAPIHHRDGQPLRDTGRLRNSLPASAASGDDYVQLGTNVEYAPRHQFGFVGTVHVKQHWRKMTQAFGKPIAPRSVLVHPYSYIATTTPRQFLPTGGLPAPWKEDVLTVVGNLLKDKAQGA